MMDQEKLTCLFFVIMLQSLSHHQHAIAGDMSLLSNNHQASVYLSIVKHNNNDIITRIHKIHNPSQLATNRYLQ